MTQLPKEAIIDYQEIYFQEFGKKISYEQAAERAAKFLRLFRAIYQPIPKNGQQINETKAH